MKNASIIFMLLSIVVSFIYSVIYLVNKNYFMAISGFGTILLVFVPYIFRKVFNKKIPIFLELIYLMHIFFGLVLGSIVDLYDIFIGYDKIIHFLSGVLTTTIGIYIFNSYCNNKNKLFLILSVIIFNVAISGFWEIIEYTYDQVFGGTAQKGLTDTMQDIISALLGSISYLILYTDKKKLN